VEVPPESYSEAVDQLTNLCPELLPAYRELSLEMGWEEEGEEIGIHLVFGDVILPFLLYALDGDADNSNSNDPEWHISGAKHRESTFRAQAAWKDIPDRDTSGLDDLVRRLYEIMDLWALSSNDHLRNAVFIEILEAGYVDLTCDDLLLNAQPAVRMMADRGHY
jgi:hypothetical protein